MKKKYILALTFLCLLMGQSSYSQDWNDEELSNNNQCDDFPEICDALSDLFGEDINRFGLNEDGRLLYIEFEGHEIEPNFYAEFMVFDYPDSYGGVDDPEVDDPDDSNEDDICYHFPMLCDDSPESISYEYTYPDNPDIPTEDEVPCTKTCDSGYELNDSCECELLLPCFGSTNTSTSNQNSALVEEIGNILNGLGIGGDAKMAVIALANGDLTDFAGYIKAVEAIGQGVAVGSALVSLDNYLNSPSTQNLLQFVFDSAAAVLSFSTGPAAPFVSFAASFANATGATSYVLGNLANLIDRSVDCNVGQGLRFIFEP